MLGELKRVAKSKLTTHEDIVATWFLWATYVLEDLPHMKRRTSFPPPQEMASWEAMRQLAIRKRKPRTKLKPNELALMIDVGDWLIEQRAVESENAANIVALLNAASIFAHAHGDPQNAQVREIYDHIANEFGAMPPAVHELPKSNGLGWGMLDREAVLRTCDALMRESDVVPDWYFYGRGMPKQVAQATEEQQEEPVVPDTGDLFDDR